MPQDRIRYKPFGIVRYETRIETLVIIRKGNT